MLKQLNLYIAAAAGVVVLALCAGAYFMGRSHERQAQAEASLKHIAQVAEKKTEIAREGIEHERKIYDEPSSDITSRAIGKWLLP